ncbi:DUF2306 domain-containing protein [Nocardiopsis sp. LOL_012]|uniref:DUF2306 domain-containing protein n=1 Tax=Nocardiopsis sp. LOL_012 TaxID=3345409 RepID=UPI003A8402C9
MAIKDKTSSPRREWLVPVLLVLLSAVPVIAGGFRLAELGGGGPVTPGNARFFDSPVPVVLHIAASALYCVLGAFQFAPGLRRRRPGWHRLAGRFLVPFGLVSALTGLWMTVSYTLPAMDGELLMVQRLGFGSAMALFLVLGFAAVRRRDIAGHRAWMVRAYAIGQGAGTQVFTHLPWVLFLGAPGEVVRAALMGAGWVVNIAVAEWVIRGHGARPSRRAERVG